MRLRTTPVRPRAEIVHYADDHTILSSRDRRLRIERDGEAVTVALPLSAPARLVSRSRLARRLLRTDKMVATPAGRDDPLSAIIAIYRGTAYHVDPASGAVRPTLELRQSRNPLHGGVGRDRAGRLYFGEYGSNPDRRAVPVYRSDDEGRSWAVIHEIEPGSTKHVHGCFWDPYEEKIWTCTGDLEGENHLLVADPDFRRIERLGDGSQLWRTCFLSFTPRHVIWGMDSQYEPSWICRLHRDSRTVERVHEVPGPIWYGKHLVDGTILMASAVEKGPSVRTRHAVIHASRDGLEWQRVYAAPKDPLPMPWFKNGVIAFDDGQRSDGAFHIFGEGLRGLDGRSARCTLEGDAAP